MSTDPTQPPPPRIVAKAARPRPKAGSHDSGQVDVPAATAAQPSSGAPWAGPQATGPQAAGAQPGGIPSQGQPPVPNKPGNPFAPPSAEVYPPAQPPSADAPPLAPGQPAPAPAQPEGQPAPGHGNPPEPGNAGAAAEAALPPEPTEVLAAAAGTATGEPGSAESAPVGTETTAVSTTDAAALEQARAERAARIEQAEAERQQRMAAQAERARRLGTVTPNAGVEQAAPVQTVVTRNTDKFAGSLGLFLLRLVTAVVVGVHGFNQLITINETSDLIRSLALPSVLQNSSTILAWIYAGGGVLAAVLLVFGFLTRFAGLLVAVGALASLVFVQWGNFQIFVANGFLGEKELLLVAIGLLFFLLGAGGWALDAGFRRSRAQRRTP